MEKIKILKDIKHDEIVKFGGKATSLGELSRIKDVNVPEGFAISTDISEVDVKNYESDILNDFDKLNSQYVAVRSSATKEDALDTSFAGQFDTFLNVTHENLLEKISECYKSLQSDRIFSYAKSKNIDVATIKVAVVVQKMIQSEISGIAFSVNPVNKEENEIMVEAGYGLGEYVVAGIITPDKYIFDKKKKLLNSSKINYQTYKLILGKNDNEKTEVPLVHRNAQKLPTKYFQYLLKNILDIEKHYGKPMDIEWAVANENVYITQARPITTLN